MCEREAAADELLMIQQLSIITGVRSQQSQVFFCCGRSFPLFVSRLFSSSTLLRADTDSLPLPLRRVSQQAAQLAGLPGVLEKTDLNDRVELLGRFQVSRQNKRRVPVEQTDPAVERKTVPFAVDHYRELYLMATRSKLITKLQKSPSGPINNTDGAIWDENVMKGDR